jgi:hypothetical protein
MNNEIDHTHEPRSSREAKRTLAILSVIATLAVGGLYAVASATASSSVKADAATRKGGSH